MLARRDHRPLRAYDIVVHVIGKGAGNGGRRDKGDIRSQTKQRFLCHHTQKRVELRGVYATQRNQCDAAFVLQPLDDCGVVGDQRQRPFLKQHLAENGGHGTVVDHNCHARLDKLQCATRHGDLGFISLALADAEVAFELRTRVDCRAAPDLADDAGLFEIVKVAMDGHLGHGKAIGQVIEVDAFMLDEQVNDRLLPFFSFHAWPPVLSGLDTPEHNAFFTYFHACFVTLLYFYVMCVGSKSAWAVRSSVIRP